MRHALELTPHGVVESRAQRGAAVLAAADLDVFRKQAYTRLHHACRASEYLATSWRI